MRRRERPRFAVWGGRMNLRKQVEPLFESRPQASSQRRHAHGAASRFAWVKRWLKRTSEPSRAKQKHPDRSPRAEHRQGARAAGADRTASGLHVDQRGGVVRPRLCRQPRRPSVRARGPLADALRARARRRRRQRNTSSAMFSAARTARRSEVVRVSPASAASAHLLVHVGGQLRDVRGIQRAPDRDTAAPG